MKTEIPNLFDRPDPATMYHTPSEVLAYIITEVHLPDFIRQNATDPPYASKDGIA